MKLCLVLTLAVVASGCGHKQVMLAGGKPVSHWLRALHDADPRLRKQAAAKLANVGPADPGVLPALTAALGDADPGVRREVILALVKFGPAAAEAVPALTHARQHDRSPTVRSYAARALAKLQDTP